MTYYVWLLFTFGTAVACWGAVPVDTCHPERLLSATQRFGRARPSELETFIRRTLSVDDAEAATQYLAGLEPAVADPILRRLVQHPMRNVRLDAIRALGEHRCDGAVRDIVAAARRGEDELNAALLAFVKIQHPATIPFLEKIAQGPRDGLVNEMRVNFAREILAARTNNPRYQALYRRQYDPHFFDPNGTVTTPRFSKTGSRTYLLGGKLMGKAIVRVVDETALNAWSKAARAEKEWREAGFDYIPVEPILNRDSVVARLNGDTASLAAISNLEAEIRSDPETANQRLVYSGVLGLSFNEFKRVATPEQMAALRVQRERILKVIDRLRIVHGHEHGENFCVAFEKGQPRLYLIDFDRSRVVRDAVPRDE
jgi:hypothetical protein